MYSSYLDRALNSLRRESFFPPVSTVPGVPTPRPIIQIVEAQKVPEMGGSGHIAYVIQTEIESHRIHHETKHRYSEFEALQKALVRIYPHVVVPSIPEKHALADYAAKQGKAKEDPLMIEKRKRMLQTFLNRIAAHPILGRDEAFHKFLEPGTAWHEALNTAVHAAILRHGNKQKNAIQKLTETRSLRNPDLHFMAAEEYTIKFSNHILHMHKTHKKLSKLLHDLSTTHLELGATYNAWSLQDKELSHGIEHLGAAFDATGTHLGKLSNALEERMTEPLQEYAALSKTIEARLAARHEKHVEFETLTETLHIKQVNLRRLEQSEAEAQRLAAALNAEGTPGHRQYIAPPSLTNGLPDEPVSPTEAARAFGHSGTTPPPPSSMSSSTFSSQRPQGLFATLNSLIDNDPETTRRVAISRNKDRITTLVEQRTGTLRDLNALNVELQEDLDRFQREKIRDLRNLLVGYAVSWRDFHRRESMMWRETGAEVERVKVEDTNSFAGQVFSRTEERGDESAVDWRRMKAPTFT
ncbi:hypothetical protein BJ742DRAFT_685434 [Cladochytrium replicatum]|nr:hypothetical protein BJ742DRAFT_685434 [Cladochytrium replicatum]